MSKKKEIVLGIDLGTTNTCVAVCKNGRIEIVPSEDENRTTPSVVCFTEERYKVGQAAKDIAHKYPKNTIHDVKRIIGSKYNDEATIRDIRNWLFTVTNCNGNPKINVERDKGKIEQYYPEQISSMVLGHVKELAEKFVDQTIDKAVITVPAYFNHSQRQATIDAAKIAGLEVLRIINEPTAAALAYGHENKSDIPRYVLVYDLGGGTFDVSIVQIDDSDYEVKATGGDSHLGGSDFDNSIVKYFIGKFETDISASIKENASAMRRLRSKCEKIKEKLSFSHSASLELESFLNDKDYSAEITRAKFEELNNELFESTLETVEKCLHDAKLTKDDMTDIVLVGGSTRIPKIQEMLTRFFNGKQLKKSVNPDEAVAYGAAIQASLLGTQKEIATFDITITDVISLSLGEADASGQFCVIIPRNTPIPYRRSEEFVTAYDNQTSTIITVYQGERALAKDNHFLGTFSISGFPAKPAGEIGFTDTFHVDHNGILHVESLQSESNLKGEIKINLTENRLPKAEIKKLIKEAREKRADDMKQRELLDARYKVESYCCTVRMFLENGGEDVDAKKRKETLEYCARKSRKAQEMQKVDGIRAILDKLRIKCDPLLEEES